MVLVRRTFRGCNREMKSGVAGLGLSGFEGAGLCCENLLGVSRAYKAVSYMGTK